MDVLKQHKNTYKSPNTIGQTNVSGKLDNNHRLSISFRTDDHDDHGPIVKVQLSVRDQSNNLTVFSTKFVNINSMI